MTHGPEALLTGALQPTEHGRLLAAQDLGLSVPRMMQEALRLLGDPAVEAGHPLLVRRLRRVVDQRRAARSGRLARHG